MTVTEAMIEAGAIALYRYKRGRHSSLHLLVMEDQDHWRNQARVVLTAALDGKRGD